ncbi:MAG: hypothetical protein V4494_02840 [Chlamydiota bacterium]
MTFSSDQRQYYLNENPFTPIIGHDDECNTVPIELLAGLQHDLDWQKAQSQAWKVIESGKFIFWRFNFGLEKGLLNLENTAYFFSFTLAIEKFIKNFLPEFASKTFGVCIYQGDLHVASRFFWSSAHEKNFKESSIEEDLYCIDVFAEYLHRLSSYFPDNLLPFCCFDTSLFTAAKGAQLLSKERFAHLHLGIKGLYQPSCSLTWDEKRIFFIRPQVSKGILLPPDTLCSLNVIKKIDELVEQYAQKGETLRIIPEMLLNEEWDGLDLVFVIENMLTTQGRRRLQGFIAAGGEISYI